MTRGKHSLHAQPFGADATQRRGPHYNGLVKTSLMFCVAAGLAYFFVTGLFLLALCKAASRKTPSPCPPEFDEVTEEPDKSEEVELLTS